MAKSDKSKKGQGRKAKGSASDGRAEAGFSLEEWQARWRQVGLACGGGDRLRAEEAIGQLYEGLSLSVPAKIVWCRSPREMIHAYLEYVGARERMNHGDRELSEALYSAIEKDSTLLWERAGKPAWTTELERAANEAARPAAMVGNFLARKLRGELVSESTDLKIERGLSLIGCSHFVRNDEYKPRTVRHCVLALLALCWFGNHDIKHLARCNYYQHLSRTRGGTISALIELAQQASWFLPTSEVCFVSERPMVLQLDERNRLHAVNGPAIAYADGWRCYSVRGIKVPPQLIEERDKLRVEDIEKERNAEMRSIKLELFGLERYVRESGAELVDEDRFGALYRRRTAGGEIITVVRVRNATAEADGRRREYFLSVPPNMERARQAVAWTFGLREEEYDPEVET